MTHDIVLAIWCDDRDAIRRYLASGGSPNRADPAELRELDRRIGAMDALDVMGIYTDDGYVNPVAFAATLGKGAALDVLLRHGGCPNAWAIRPYPLMSLLISIREVAKGPKREQLRLVIQVLIDNQADVSVGCRTGIPPLVECAVADDTEVAVSLLDAGADPNVQDYDGDTALMWAVRNGSLHFVDLLLRHGARLDVQNDRHETAVMLADQYGVQLNRTLC